MAFKLFLLFTTIHQSVQFVLHRKLGTLANIYLFRYIYIYIYTYISVNNTAPRSITFLRSFYLSDTLVQDCDVFAFTQNTILVFASDNPFVYYEHPDMSHSLNVLHTYGKIISAI